MLGSASKINAACPPRARIGAARLSHAVSPFSSRWDSEKVRGLGVCLRCLTCLT